LAEAWGLRVEMQSWGYTLIEAANLDFSLGYGRTGYFELPVPHEPFEYGVDNPYRIQPDGFLYAPIEPGLGIAVDWERMKAATIGSFSCTARNPDPH
jgi:L-alanine-DL-glutamate epimerase-like enolase superfamily enzyme